MRDQTKEFFRYLPISEREKQWGLYVAAGGSESIESGGQFPRSGHPKGYGFSWSKGRILSEYQAHYITRGEGVFESKPTGVKKLAAGNAFLLFPDVWHRYHPVADVGWEDHWVSFNGEDVERLVRHGFISPEKPVLHTGLDDLIQHGYSILLDRLRSEPVGFEQLLAASVMEILASMLGAVRAQKTDNGMHELVCRAKSLLEAQGDAMPAMEKLSASLGLGTTRFYRIFKEHTGLSPYQYHQQLRIERAKQMLHGTTMSIKQVAGVLAFESPFHFSKAFKLKTGMSPSQWRQRGQSTEGKSEK